MRKMVLAAFAATMLSGVAYADVVVDRGLPTANLNNAAGANQSNVAWADSEGFYGDSFTLGGGSGTTYTIDALRTWVIARDGAPVSASLYTGVGANADLAETSSTASFTLVTYDDASDYQTLGGAYRSLYQVDFTGLNIVATGGTTISFGVDGVNQGGYAFFNHASNAALSGSPQDSADNVMSYYLHDGPGATYDSAFDSNGNGWNKSSDINVQVFATVSEAPEPAAWAMMVAGFGAIGGAMRGRRKVAVRFA